MAEYNYNIETDQGETKNNCGANTNTPCRKTNTLHYALLENYFSQ